MWIQIIIYLILCIFIYLIRYKKISIKISKKLLIQIGVILFLVNTISFGMEIYDYFTMNIVSTKKIEREAQGGAVRSEKYEVQIEGEKEEHIEVQISPQIYEKAQLESLFSEAMVKLEKEVLGTNSSFDSIEQDLTLPTDLDGYPFTISWELSRYDVMDLSGKLIQEELTKKDPDRKGIHVTLTGILKYEENEKKHQIELMVFAREEEKTMMESLQILVKNADEKSREQRYLTLPDEWNGKKLTWLREEETSNKYILFLGILFCVLMIFNEKDKEEKSKKQRREEMMLDYPEIIGQFTMLMGAGMTAKNVWKKIAEDYKIQKANTGRKREAYEEILYTWQEMQSGVSEQECYEHFAKRCEVLPYMKMGALLAQNQKKGSKGLAQMLTMEAMEAMEERKNRAKRLGEEAATKLLLPMLMMLIVVLAIIVVPAFWAANL